MSILIFVVILLVLVLVHEWGHFFSAKKFGIRVDEFGFGFPPKLFGIKKGETEYTFNAIPFGGFVKIFGENPDEASINGPDANRSLISKPRWQQAIVLFAGVFMNFVLAWVLFSFTFMSGLPTSVENAPKNSVIQDSNLVVTSLPKDSLAGSSGLQIGDKIIYLKDNNDIFIEAPNIDSKVLKSFVVSNGNKEIEIGYLRGKNKELNSIKLTPLVNVESGVPMIGVGAEVVGVLKLSFFDAFASGMKLTISKTKETGYGLYKLVADGIKGNGSFDSVAGPIGIVGVVGDARELGFVYLLYFAALISINLAIINLVPFPALDGGRLLFLLIEKIKGSRINTKFANYANMIGFAILIILMLVVTYHDIVKLVK